MIRYVIQSSYGNDSIAMIRWAFENRLKDVTVVYCDTGWSAPWWNDRVLRSEAICALYGFKCVRIQSEGFVALAKRKKSFPRQGIQFCTEELKIKPSINWLDANDPTGQATIMVGKRRAESANRANTPEFVLYSDLHGGRRLWHPLFDMTDEKRNELVLRSYFTVLPHRSMECFPCINSNRADLRALADSPERVDYIASLEDEMGYTSKGKPRTFFRPYRYMGATGIREIMRWAESDPGKFDLDDGTGNECHSGVCG